MRAQRSANEIGSCLLNSDSVHALIESANSQNNIYVPSELHELILNAKVTREIYIVNKIKQNDKLDFHAVAEEQNWKKIICGNKITWIPDHGDEACEEQKNKFEASRVKKRERPKK